MTDESPLTDEELERYANLSLAPFSGVPEDIRDALGRLVTEVQSHRAVTNRQAIDGADPVPPLTDELLAKLEAEATKRIEYADLQAETGGWSGLPPEYRTWELVRRMAVELRRLRKAIREHRDQKADDRCWLDDQKLYAVLGDGDLGDNRVGDKEAMLANCRRFLGQRTAGGGWVSYRELEAEVQRLQAENERLLTVLQSGSE